MKKKRRVSIRVFVTSLRPTIKSELRCVTLGTLAAYLRLKACVQAQLPQEQEDDDDDDIEEKLAALNPVCARNMLCDTRSRGADLAVGNYG